MHLQTKYIVWCCLIIFRMNSQHTFTNWHTKPQHSTPIATAGKFWQTDPEISNFLQRYMHTSLLCRYEQYRSFKFYIMTFLLRCTYKLTMCTLGKLWMRNIWIMWLYEQYFILGTTWVCIMCEFNKQSRKWLVSCFGTLLWQECLK